MRVLTLQNNPASLPGPSHHKAMQPPQPESGSTSAGSSSKISRSSSSSSFTSSDSPLSDHDVDAVCSYRCLKNFVQDSHAQSSLFCLALHEGLLCGGRGDNQISVWRNSDASEVAKLKSRTSRGGAVKAILMAGDKLFSAHQDNRVRVWRISTVNHGQKCHLATLPTLRDQARSAVNSRSLKKKHRVHHTDVVTSLALGDNILYSASRDKTVKVWSLDDFRCIESFPAHDAAVNGLVSSVELGLLFTCSADATVCVWQRTQQQQKNQISDASSERIRHRKMATLVNSSCVNVVAQSSDGGVLYAGGSDASIAVWERCMEEGVYEKRSVLGGHSQAVLCMATLDNELMCSGSGDKSIRVWRRGVDASYTCVCVVRGHEGPVKSVVLTVDRFGFCNVHSAGLDARARVWRVDYRPRRGEDDNKEEVKMSSEYYYFTCGDGDQGGRMNSIKCALDEDARHFQLVFQALQSS